MTNVPKRSYRSMLRAAVLWISAGSWLVHGTPAAEAQSLLDWWRGRTNVVNVYVPPGAVVATTPVRATTVTAARPTTVYTPPITTGMTSPPVLLTTPVPAAAVPATALPTTAVPSTTVPVTGATTVAQGYTVQYRVQTRYRTRWVQVPVTVYRPVTTVDPVTGARTTMTQPCQSYTWQVRRVPVTQWRPVRVLYGPPPAGSIPTITLPSTAATTAYPVAAGSTAAPSAAGSVPADVPFTTTPAPWTSVPSPSVPSFPSTTGAAAPAPAPSAVPPSSGSDRADRSPRISPEEAQRLSKPPTSAPGSSGETSSGGGDTSRNGRVDDARADGNSHDGGGGPSHGSEAGPALDPPANARPSTDSAGLRSLGPPPHLKPIPRVPARATQPVPATQPDPSIRPPASPPVRRPDGLEEPPQLLDPRDALVTHSSVTHRVMRTSWQSGRTETASGRHSSPLATGGSSRKAATPQPTIRRYRSTGWRHVELGE